MWTDSARRVILHVWHVKELQPPAFPTMLRPVSIQQYHLEEDTSTSRSSSRLFLQYRVPTSTPWPHQRKQPWFRSSITSTRKMKMWTSTCTSRTHSQHRPLLNWESGKTLFLGLIRHWDMEIWLAPTSTWLLALLKPCHDLINMWDISLRIRWHINSTGWRLAHHLPTP